MSTDPELIFQNPNELDPIPDGRYAFFDDDDGSLLVKTYKHGKLNGTSFWHYASGEPWSDQDFVDDVIHGVTVYYDKDGSVLKTEVREHGQMISFERGADSDSGS